MYRIFVSLMAFLFILALTACGAKSPTTENSQGTVGEVKDKQEQDEENAAEDASEGEDADVGVLEETFGSWKSKTGTVWVNSSSVIQNSGSTSAYIDDVTIEFYDGEGNLIGRSPMIDPIPLIIMPGDTAYVTESFPLEDTITDPSQVKDAKIYIEASATDEEQRVLETNDVEIVLEQPDIDIPYAVTGILQNPHSVRAENAYISAALYDANDKLLGVLKNGGNLSVEANSSEEFRIIYPELPGDIGGKAIRVEVKAYNK